MKIYINAMAETKARIESEMSGRSLSRALTHILCIILAPDSQTVNHWMNEIYAFRHDIDKLKGKNKFPSANEIYKWSYNKKQDLITDVNWMKLTIEDVKDNENISDSRSPATISKIMDSICVEYFKWLAENLSKVGVVSNRQVHEKLNELIDKYNKA